MINRARAPLAMALLAGLCGCVYNTYPLDLCREVGCPCQVHADCASPELACDLYRRPSRNITADTAPYGSCVAATLVSPGYLPTQIDNLFGPQKKDVAIRLGAGASTLGAIPYNLAPGYRLTIFGSTGSTNQSLVGNIKVTKGTLTLDGVQLNGTPPGVAIDCDGTADSQSRVTLRRVNIFGYETAVKTTANCRLTMDRSRLNENQGALALAGGYSITNSLILDNAPPGDRAAVDLAFTTDIERTLALTTIRNNPAQAFRPSIVIDFLQPQGAASLIGLLIADNGGPNAAQTGGTLNFPAAPVGSFCGGRWPFSAMQKGCTSRDPLPAWPPKDDPYFPRQQFTASAPIQTETPCPLGTAIQDVPVPPIGDVDPMRFDYFGAPRSGACYAGAIQPQP